MKAKADVLAIIATYNERRFIADCVENLIRQGIDIYLIDNESTDDTVEIANAYSGRGIVAIETQPRDGCYQWGKLLSRKAQIATDSNYKWIMHLDADEIRLAPPGWKTIARALEYVDAQGFNAVNFMEYSFVPTIEQPDHDHQHFQATMRWYYPFLPVAQNRLNLWKRQPAMVDLVTTGGHKVNFPGIKPYPTAFPMRHYLFLSIPHAIEKWVRRDYAPDELAKGWHKSRAQLSSSSLWLQSQTELRRYITDAQLDASKPLTKHPIFTSR